MICKGCGTPLNDDYLFCPTCGETAHAHRLDIKHVIHEFIHAFVHADKGIFLLIRSLATEPGKAAAEYCAGNRKKYFNPVSFLLLAGGFTFFLRLKLGFTGALGSKKMASAVGVFLHEFTTPVIVLSIPLISLFSWLFFKSSGKNFAENMVMNMYMQGEYHLFTIVLTVLPAWLLPHYGLLFTFMGFLVMGIYYYFTALYFFKETRRATFLKVIGIELLFVISFGLIMGISLIIFLIQSGVHVKDLQ
ncbi:MAG: DUF3667 domain-containing protein [Bacteroidota bacterium]